MDQLVAKQGYIYLIGCTIRPGAVRFATQLEHLHYAPQTQLNELYNIFHTLYNKSPYYILEVPTTDHEKIVELAAECNLKLVNGKPFAPGQSSFRLICDSNSCFTLETLDLSILPSDLRPLLKKEYVEAQDLLK